jgi:putative Ca2+/H+ antiporter (TMEM165/GDT1 family)
MMLFLNGATFMGCIVAAVYFLRFWRETRDRLFVLFAIAFAVLAMNRAALALSHLTAESTPYFYLVRLAAFLLIAFAVIDKNRRG